MGSARPPIRILCVDDHRIVREGLVRMLGRQPDFAVVGSAATGEESIALVGQLRPDVILMDLQLPHMSGLDAIRSIRREHPEAHVIVLTMHAGDEDVYRALQAGAATFLTKDTALEDLVRVVRQVHEGQRPMPPEIEARLAARASQPALTEREVEVMELIAKGLSNKEIAASLGISERTAEHHVQNLFAKLGVNDRIGAINVARRRGIIHTI